MELPAIVGSECVVAHRSEVFLADVRWYLDGRSGRAAFEQAHVPGAIFVDLERDLSGPGEPSDGRHPFPSPAVFATIDPRLGHIPGAGNGYWATNLDPASRLYVPSWSGRSADPSRAAATGGVATGPEQ